MSDKPKDVPANIYDEIRREMREKQQARREHGQSVVEMFNQRKNNLLDRFKGEINENDIKTN